MQISTRADYAVGAAIELACIEGSQATRGDVIAGAQGMPLKYMEKILGDLRAAGLISSQRGPGGGYRLARDPAEISVADIIRAVEGSLTSVHGNRPEDIEYVGSAQPLLRVWVAAREAMRQVVEDVSLAHLAAGRMPVIVDELLEDPEAWVTRQSNDDRQRVSG